MFRTLGYLVAANFQAVALILAALWGGDWLNSRMPIGFNWYWITFTVALLAAAQTFYVLIRAAMVMDKRTAEASAKGKGPRGPEGDRA